MKDRNILCKHYIKAGLCDLGRICYIHKEMVHCSKYEKDNKRKPFRENNKKKQNNKDWRKEKYD